MSREKGITGGGHDTDLRGSATLNPPTNEGMTSIMQLCQTATWGILRPDGHLTLVFELELC